MSETAETLTLKRHLPADPETVFAAWTDGANLRRWFIPGGVTVTEAELDVRVGGRFRIVMCGNDSGRDFGHDGEYLEVDPPRRLVFTWSGPSDPGSLVTIELRPEGGGTELTLTHERTPNAETREAYRGGWTRILESQAKHLAAEAA